MKSLDLLQQLTRLEIDLCRLSNKNYLSWAVLSIQLCQRIGDSAFHRLALWDLAMTLNMDQMEPSLEQLRELSEAEGDPKLKCLLDRPLESVSGKTAWEARQNATPTHSIADDQILEAFLPEASESKQFYINRERKYVLTLPEGNFLSLEAHPQLLQILEVLAKEPSPSMQSFFQKIWGQQTFSVHLHGQLIRSTLSRLKKYVGINCGLKGDSVHSDSVQVL